MRTLQQSVYWCFTINHDFDHWRTPTDLKAAISIHLPEIKYIGWQIERSTSTDHLHVQGYLELSKRLRRNQVTRIVGRGTHLERRKGTRTQARDYVRKEETRVDGPFEIGTWENEAPTKNQTLETIKVAIQEGKKISDIANENFGLYLRHGKMFTHYKLLISKPREEKTKVIVVYGPTGSGKSHWARETFPDAYWKCNSKWWDLYEDQETVICDEFYGWIPYNVLLRIADKYPCMVESKFGHLNFNAKTLIILSNDKISEWYKEGVMRKNAFFRRIDEFIYIPSRGNIQKMTYAEAKVLNLTDNESEVSFNFPY